MDKCSVKEVVTYAPIYEVRMACLGDMRKTTIAPLLQTVYACVYIDLHITAQSVPVISTVLYHSLRLFRRGNQCVCVCVMTFSSSGNNLFGKFDKHIN